MYISDVHEYNPEPTEQAREFLAQGQKEKLKSAIEDIVNGEFDRLEEYANEFISQVAASRAERFLKRVLEGDAEAGASLLGDEYGGSRHRLSGCEQGKPWAHLIHGNLFETEEIKLRKQIVEAHADLLRNERIADLESIVEGLTLQVRELTARLENR